jgi:hypothetical protein
MKPSQKQSWIRHKEINISCNLQTVFGPSWKMERYSNATLATVSKIEPSSANNSRQLAQIHIASCNPRHRRLSATKYRPHESIRRKHVYPYRTVKIPSSIPCCRSPLQLQIVATRVKSFTEILVKGSTWAEKGHSRQLDNFLLIYTRTTQQSHQLYQHTSRVFTADQLTYNGWPALMRH